MACCFDISSLGVLRGFRARLFMANMDVKTAFDVATDLTAALLAEMLDVRACFKKKTARQIQSGAVGTRGNTCCGKQMKK